MELYESLDTDGGMQASTIPWLRVSATPLLVCFMTHVYQESLETISCIVYLYQSMNVL